MTDQDPPPLDHLAEENRELIRALREGEPGTRAEALDEVADFMDDEIAHEVLRLIEDKSNQEQLRAHAAIALGPALEDCDLESDETGQLPDPDDPLNLAPVSTQVFGEMTARLHRVYSDAGTPVLVRRRVLEASVRAPQAWHEAAIRAAWASDDPDWRITALFGMGFHYGMQSTTEIEQGLNDASAEVRLEAIVAAGRRELGELLEPIAGIALDARAERHLRLTAVEALAAIPGSQPTLQRLSEDSTSEIAEAAEEALLEQPTPEDFDDSVFDELPPDTIH